MKRLLTSLAMFVLIAPLAAMPEPTADEVHANRRRFEQLLRKHPEQADKLRADARTFFGFPKERRQQIAQIHLELHKETSATQVRLLNVLDRYVQWLDELDDTTRKLIANAPDKAARLALIKDVREKEWIKDQPRATREQIEKLSGEPRQAFIAKEKAEERRRRIEWLMASRFWNELEGEVKGRRLLPKRVTELPFDVQAYVNNYLLKMFLTAEEKDQLAKREGQWPQFPMKLVELADKHPAALPGPLGPKSMVELPAKVYKDLLSKTSKPLIKKDPASQPALLANYLKIKANKWPEFGIELARAARVNNIVFEHEFLAYNYDCLTPLMQEFMSKKLEPVLDAKETHRLTKAIGKWPEFPQTIQELANHHRLHVPWFTLPRVENWENYRLHRGKDALLPAF
jgi:hypothetical protein